MAKRRSMKEIEREFLGIEEPNVDDAPTLSTEDFLREIAEEEAALGEALLERIDDIAIRTASLVQASAADTGEVKLCAEFIFVDSPAEFVPMMHHATGLAQECASKLFGDFIMESTKGQMARDEVGAEIYAYLRSALRFLAVSARSPAYSSRWHLHPDPFSKEFMADVIDPDFFNLDPMPELEARLLRIASLSKLGDGPVMEYGGNPIRHFRGDNFYVLSLALCMNYLLSLDIDNAVFSNYPWLVRAQNIFWMARIAHEIMPATEQDIINARGMKQMILSDAANKRRHGASTSMQDKWCDQIHDRVSAGESIKQVLFSLEEEILADAEEAGVKFKAENYERTVRRWYTKWRKTQGLDVQESGPVDTKMAQVRQQARSDGQSATLSEFENALKNARK